MDRKQGQSRPSDHELHGLGDQPDDALPSYGESVGGYDGPAALNTRDPRSTSTESLTPELDGEKRTLLLIYVHGFMGNETSFQSFPAHVHHLACSLLSETHVVHTKIYPRYKSRKVIEFARNDFSNWLRPHESYHTDVILLGHSMGGILGAEVAIMPAHPPSSPHPFQHKLLGTINFDTPFLGMHPGIVFAGIGSLFRPAPEPPRPGQQADQGGTQPLSPSSSAAQPRLTPSKRQQSVDVEGRDGASSSSADASSTQLSVQPTPSPLLSPTDDPNYNPQFTNDAPVPRRQGWEKTLNFLMKHSGDIRTATKTYVTSHLEFGGALADFNGLKNRYTVLRLLEDGKDINGKATRKIGFVNYYTASIGRPPRAKAVVPESDNAQNAAEEERKALEDGRSSLEGSLLLTDHGERQDQRRTGQRSPEASSRQSPGAASRRESIASDFENVHVSDEDLYGDGMGPEHATAMTSIEPEAVIEPELGAEPETETSTSLLPIPSTQSTEASSSNTALSVITSTSSLPPLGPIPKPPDDLDLDSIADKDERKLAVKDYSRQMQAYQRAIKDREKAVKERQKLLDKRDKAAEKDRLKQLKQEEKEKAKAKKEEKKKAESKAEEAVAPSEPRSDQAPEPDETDAPNEEATLAKKTEIFPPRDPNSAKKKDKPTKASKPPKDKPKKDRKFCMLPPKKSNGQDDKCWSRVFMEGVDEVGAHCGLFFADRPHYEALVYDVGNRIREWVVEARVAQEERLLATQDLGRWRERGEKQ